MAIDAIICIGVWSWSHQVRSNTIYSLQMSAKRAQCTERLATGCISSPFVNTVCCSLISLCTFWAGGSALATAGPVFPVCFCVLQLKTKYLQHTHTGTCFYKGTKSFSEETPVLPTCTTCPCTYTRSTCQVRVPRPVFLAEASPYRDTGTGILLFLLLDRRSRRLLLSSPGFGDSCFKRFRKLCSSAAAHHSRWQKPKAIELSLAVRQDKYLS